MVTNYYEDDKQYPVLQFRIKPLVYEFLKEDGKRFGLSVNQYSKQLLITHMIEKKMLPAHTLQKIAEELILSVAKRKIENAKT